MNHANGRALSMRQSSEKYQQVMPTPAEMENGLKNNQEASATNVVRPGSLYVCKRDGVRVSFHSEKINLAITKAFLAVKGGQMAQSEGVHHVAQLLTNKVVQAIEARKHGGGLVHIEDIQDQVELALMREGEHQVARAYVIYRNERAKERNARVEATPVSHALRITNEQGKLVPIDPHYLHHQIHLASQGLEGIDANLVYDQVIRSVYDGVNFDDLAQAQVMTCHTLIEKDPNYGYLAARFLLAILIGESNRLLEFTPGRASLEDLASCYGQAFVRSIHFGIDNQLLDNRLASVFDLQTLASHLAPQRDFVIDYLGMRTLYDRYFLHHNDTRFELPQVFFMRVAMGLALEEDNPTERAREFYTLLTNFDFMCSTPTLFNAGTLRSQLSSCYLSTVPDNLDGIFGAIHENAMLSKWAGGLGNDWTPVRALHSRIKGTNGKSQGVVPFLKVANDTAVAVNQGGKRKGALCAYLETWHLDIEQFLELRKNTGDDRRRTHDMNTANWVPDVFMQRITEDSYWTLFSPSDTPDLHDLYGKAFAARYQQYESMADAGDITNFKRMPAKVLWRKMLGAIFETGHPWITFKDAINLRSPQQHVGVVHSSNLCTEITLNTSSDEVAVCNLGSINLVQHVTGQGGLDIDKLKRTIRTAIRMLDNVIDINYYSIEKARNANLRHRPIGLGLMGFHDALIKQGIAYASQEAVDFADTSMEHISYFAIEASANLARERGNYASFDGSLWSKGVLPIDSIDTLRQQRPEGCLDMNTTTTLNWQPLRELAQGGMRNSNVMAIAPTATIGNIVGVSKSIDPIFQNLFVSTNLSGDFIVYNRALVAELKQRGLWDEAMINDLKVFEGDVHKCPRIPKEIADIYSTAFQIHPKWLIEAASRRQKWLDQSQSLNIFVGVPDGRMLDQVYRNAWFKGLKTTYYLRSVSATSAEKSTVNDTNLNKVAIAPSCNLEEGCEACQ